MNINIRTVTSDDVAIIGQIIYKAFCGIADRHNFPHDFLSAEQAQQFAQMLAGNPAIYGLVAESDGRVLGSNFLWEQNEIAGVGPITIDPGLQSKGVGRLLMQAVIERGQKSSGIRLVQDAFNTASMSLYTSLGFDIKEMLVLIGGTLNAEELPENITVRPLTEKDYPACDELCRKILGFSRTNELRETSQMLPAFGAFRDDRLTGYASAPNFWQVNHAVAEREEDLLAILQGAGNLTGQPLSFLLPVRQSNLFRLCLKKGLKVIKPMSLMSLGSYTQPQGAFLPSVLY